RLERYFSKKDILEFYLNQFYVAGNGHGLGIAARYFFNKEIHDLSLVEMAYIAGSVKGPQQYNPFIAKSKSAKTRKLAKAKSRTHYVLRKMLENGKITDEQYQDALKEDIPFKNGNFRFRLSTNMVTIRQLMESSPIKERLEEYGIENYMSAGLNIVTSLDKDLQESLEYACYKNLSELDIIFSGYQSPEKKKMSIVSKLEPGGFYTGKICSLVINNGRPEKIQVRFGATKAWINKKSITAFLKLQNRHLSGRNSLPSKSEIKKISGSFLSLGKYILCSVPLSFYPTEKSALTLEIEKKPVLQGGARILKNGNVLATVGGFMNTGYNRVEQAERQFGSTYKPLVYAAALGLGWKPLDSLLNSRMLFRLGPTFYFPRPYHKAEPVVSMVWAGKHSENIASVYLLYNLFKKLDYSQFWKMCDSIGYGPDSFSSSRDYPRFVRDSLGLLMTRGRIKEISYHKIIEETGIDLLFEGKDKESEFLKQFPYGRGFKKELKKYRKKKSKEDKIHMGILNRCFLSYLEKAKKARYNSGKQIKLWINAESKALSVFSKRPDAPWELYTPDKATPIETDTLIEGHIGINTLFQISKTLEKTDLNKPAYSKDLLFASEEFKALIALRYIILFCQKLGISTTLEPVISFPLGSNTITLAEMTEAYQSLKDGKRYFSKNTGRSQLIIREISLSNGKVIFQDSMTAYPVLTEKAKNGISAILKSVVEGGTGSRIHAEFKINSGSSALNFPVSIPAYGKTGTTNDQRNGAFIGYISGPVNDRGTFSPEDGYTIGVYSGFDDNSKMVRKGFIGYGGTVSLSPWITAAFAVSKFRQFPEKIDFNDLSLQIAKTVPLIDSDRFKSYNVSIKTGLPVLKTEFNTKETTTFSMKQ
ncbi:MAG: transglycosylase domain-containing protein, partial [Fibrobacteria bacterium]|nr:transglycosylase domain-containing protein [Fibrobacteria bacterium]